MTTATRLERLKYYSTIYELAAEKNGERVLIAYAPKGRSSLLRACRNRSAAVVALTGSTSIDFAKRAQDGANANGWTLRFTGRTQREAIIEGELPYILEVVK